MTNHTSENHHNAIIQKQKNRKAWFVFVWAVILLVLFLGLSTLTYTLMTHDSTISIENSDEGPRQMLCVPIDQPGAGHSCRSQTIFVISAGLTSFAIISATTIAIGIASIIIKRYRYKIHNKNS